MINANFITSGLKTPYGLAISGNNLCVVNFSGNSVGEYNALTGATINAALITGPNHVAYFAIVPEPGTWTLLGLGVGGLGEQNGNGEVLLVAGGRGEHVSVNWPPRL